jgi:hypothetical protein
VKKRRVGFSTIRDLELGRLSEGEKHLAEFVIAVQHGGRIPSRTFRFLKAALQQILAGEEPTTALKLNKKRGRRDVPASVCDQVAREVWAEKFYGANYDEAVEVVAKRHGLTRNTVASYYAKSKRTGGVPPQVRSSRQLYPVNPIERQKYLEGRLKNP